MMKKILTIAAALTLLFSLAACSSASVTKTPITNTPPTTDSSTPGKTAPMVTPTVMTFTLAQLAKYNGKNGQPAYIAASGVVYDVTNAQGWNNGSHQGISAGQDITSALSQAPHGTSVIKGLTVIGKLQ